MVNPYKARVDRREFLNLPGFHDGAYVVAYVEDSSTREIESQRSYQRNPQPRVILEISDCEKRINLEFELASALDRMNSFHKIDTLLEALNELRAGLVAECIHVRSREQALQELEAAEQAQKEHRASAAQLDLLARAAEGAA
jgi:hypothetical protein